MSAAEFFDLVDRYVTAPMEARGHERIGRYDEVGSNSRGIPLQPHRISRLLPRRYRVVALRLRRTSGPKEHVLEVGYEAPAHLDEEHWVHYYPDSGELDVRDWADMLIANASGGMAEVAVVRDPEELKGRLRELGQAIAASPPLPDPGAP